MKTITINGKEYPCRVTMGAMLRFKRETGHDASQLDERDVSDLITFLWCCMASASKADGVEFSLSLMDFADRLDPDTLTGFYTSMEKEPANNPEKKNGGVTDILTLFGTATGCMGMSIDDFCRCTPLEFSKVHEAWAESEQRRERAAWERARMLCTCMLQPYSRHRLEPQDVMKFAWEIEEENRAKQSAKEIRERFEKVKREQGLE